MYLAGGTGVGSVCENSTTGASANGTSCSPHSAMAALAVDPAWEVRPEVLQNPSTPAELIEDTAVSILRDALSIRELHSSGANWIARAAEELPVSSIAFLHGALLAFRADHRGDVVAFGGPDLEDSVSNQFEEEC